MDSQLVIRENSVLPSPQLLSAQFLGNDTGLENARRSEFSCASNLSVYQFGSTTQLPLCAGFLFSSHVVLALISNVFHYVLSQSQTTVTTMGSATETPPIAEIVKHIPRAYQEELFIQAQRSNVIATLDTGSGKTFIAALLIKWICSLPSSTGKKVVFLVPKVPLVDQHCDFLSIQTHLVVRGYKGAMGVDEWDEPRWRKEFSSADVLVMTGTLLFSLFLFLTKLTHPCSSDI